MRVPRDMREIYWRYTIGSAPDPVVISKAAFRELLIDAEEGEQAQERERLAPFRTVTEEQIDQMRVMVNRDSQCMADAWMRAKRLALAWWGVKDET